VSALQLTPPLHSAKAALSGGKTVGTIALRDTGNFQAALRKMFVKASHRGKAHAVGTKLLNHLIARARTGGVQDVFLGTSERFLAAHRFYEKNAFRRMAPESLPLAFPRMSLDTRFYHRTLRRDDT
jgi:GNAT superfamily N-acetyltransferase